MKRLIIFIIGLLFILFGWATTHQRELDTHNHIYYVSVTCKTDATGRTYCINHKTGEGYYINGVA